MPVFENERGTFIYNSKDLCMIEHIPELIGAGLSSFKIEGRIKSSYYVATVVRAYRMAIDKYFENPKEYKYDNQWLEEIEKASHREFTTGFYFNKPKGTEQIYDNSSYIREYTFVGMVLDYDKDSKIATIEQRNRMFVNNQIEVVSPNGYFTQKIKWMKDIEDNDLESAPHPQMIIRMPMEKDVEPFSILRKKVE